MRLVTVLDRKTVKIESIPTPDFDWDTGGRDCKQYLDDLFDSMILNIIEDMRENPEVLLQKFGAADKKSLYPVFKTLGKILNKMTVGGVARLLCIHCDKSIRKMLFKNYVVELVRGVLEGNQTFVEGTPKGDVLLAAIRRLRFVFKKLRIKTLEGVKGVILTSDQVQVVFGPGKAHRAAKAMSELLGEAPVQDAAEIAAQNKRQLKAKQTSGVQQFLAKFATIFTPGRGKYALPAVTLFAAPIGNIGHQIGLAGTGSPIIDILQSHHIGIVFLNECGQRLYLIGARGHAFVGAQRQQRKRAVTGQIDQAFVFTSGSTRPRQVGIGRTASCH